MKKLTKAQQQVIDDAKRMIDFARSHDYRHYVAARIGWDLDKDYSLFSNPYCTLERAEQETDKAIARDELEAGSGRTWKDFYDKQRNGIVFVRASTHTIEALERMGLIEVVRVGGRAFDDIKLLNY